jgi:hypothetical protein
VPISLRTTETTLHRATASIPSASIGPVDSVQQNLNFYPYSLDA